MHTSSNNEIKNQQPVNTAKIAEEKSSKRYRAKSKSRSRSKSSSPVSKREKIDEENSSNGNRNNSSRLDKDPPKTSQPSIKDSKSSKSQRDEQNSEIKSNKKLIPNEGDETAKKEKTVHKISNRLYNKTSKLSNSTSNKADNLMPQIQVNKSVDNSSNKTQESNQDSNDPSSNKKRFVFLFKPSNNNLKNIQNNQNNVEQPTEVKKNEKNLAQTAESEKIKLPLPRIKVTLIQSDVNKTSAVKSLPITSPEKSQTTSFSSPQKKSKRMVHLKKDLTSSPSSKLNNVVTVAKEETKVQKEPEIKQSQSEMESEFDELNTFTDIELLDLGTNERVSL